MAEPVVQQIPAAEPAEPAVPVGPAVPAVPAVPDNNQGLPAGQEVQGGDLEQWVDDAASLAAHSQRSVLDPVAAAARDANVEATREIVESVSNLVASQNPAASAQLLMLKQDEIRGFSVSLPQAPAIFRQVYDTGSNFTWALAGFNFILGSFYRGGVRTRESQTEICAGNLAALRRNRCKKSACSTFFQTFIEC